jgi:hypothetical protein
VTYKLKCKVYLKIGSIDENKRKEFLWVEN